ncbi:hypothetical protein PG996_008853 [Apiospora saccharicola]|uniref:Uncharacterized protein n=1 Tax=Apiospora saccharicola TaxID=335842 RepID=A0ABR1UZ37_9PEZI
MDPNKRNFKNVESRWLMYDFENPKKLDDVEAYNENCNEKERKQATLAAQKPPLSPFRGPM